jgi:hypothetical protein
MTQVAGTFSSYDSNRLREEFRDAIYMISPEETPFWSTIDHETIVSKHPEWQTDTLATPTSTNQQVEADDYSYTAPAATTRIGNYTETAWKTYIIGDGYEEMSKAGPQSELGRERRKKGLELKQDVEVALLANKASVVGDDTAARKTAGFAAWITSNESRGSGGIDGGFASGTVAVSSTGTQRAFERAQLDTVLLNCQTSGGNPTMMMGSPYLKQVFSSFMQGPATALVQTNVKGDATIYASASTYYSDFGPIDFLVNRQLHRAGANLAKRLYVIDPSKVSIGIFRDIREDRPAKTGDAEKRAIKVEYALIMKNQAAHATVEDLFGLSAST